MRTSIRSFAMSLSFFSSLTRHCWSVERNPRPFRLPWYSAYTPTFPRLSRLAMLEQMGGRRLEMGGDVHALTECQILHLPLGDQSHQGEAAVNDDTHMGAGRNDPLHASRQAIEGGGPGGLGRARKERHVLGTEAEPYPLPRLGRLSHLDPL